MRKISKSRADDDVVSSTNGSGSLGNDDQQEADQSGEHHENKSTAKENDESHDESDNSKDNSSRYKSKSRKRKAGKNKNDDTESELKDFNQSDDESEVSKEVSKKTPKGKVKAKPKNDNNESELKEINQSDDESKVSKEVSKRTPKGKAKTKPKIRKSGREIKKNVEEEEEYEVERIIDSKRIKGKLHYLIRWKGYSADTDSWEPHDTLSCPDVINKYNEEKENPSTKSNKRRPKKKESKVSAKRAKTNWDSENADENAEYEVERILEVHHKKNGEREFLIHWKGWSSKFDSWEPEKNLNCPDLIKRFMDKVTAARSTHERSLRVAPETTHRFTLQAPSSGRRLSKRRGHTQRVRYDNAE